MRAFTKNLLWHSVPRFDLGSIPMNIVVREALPEDAVRIVTLIHMLAKYEEMTEECTVDPYELLASLKTDTILRPFYIVAEDRSLLVGYTCYYPSKYRSFTNTWNMYLHDIFVRETYQGKGIGRLLLTTVAQDTLAKGLSSIVFSVLEWNKDAIAAYEKMGAKQHSGYQIDEAGRKWLQMSFSGFALEMLAAGTVMQ